MAGFPHYQQFDAMSCGPTCLRIIARHYGRSMSASEAEDLAFKGKQGVNLLSLCEAAESLGFRTLPVQCALSDIVDKRRVPFIAHWNQNHFLVVYRITATHIYVSDPAAPRLMRYPHAEFERWWANSVDAGEKLGIALFFELTPAFEKEAGTRPTTAGGTRIILSYLAMHRGLVGQLLLGTVLASTLLFVSPFLTQSLVDQGVQLGDRRFVKIFLIAQACLLAGTTTVELLRSWVLLYLSSRISVSLVADFLASIMALPLSFFDKRSTGDVLQRLDDHQRIERFLTSHALESVFSFVLFVVYGVIIASFNLMIFAAFALGTAATIVWVLWFLEARQRLDHRRFNELGQSRAAEIELIRGIAEIKLAGAEKHKRWDWERLQAQIFRINIAGMKLEQLQHSGSATITSAMMVLTTGLAASSVIDGSMSLGTMMAIGMMLGQLHVPLSNILLIAQEGQNAAISMRRMIEVSTAEPEDPIHKQYVAAPQGDIVLDKVSFRYGDRTAPWVIADLDLTIPAGKTTAVVGASGSGKTTLLKLLLKFYEPEAGEIRVGPVPLIRVRGGDWRLECGAVMQDGFVFYETIARNIAVTDERIDRARMVWAAEMANAREFIETLPLGYNTKVGDNGLELSGGQKQRLLIARAVYRQPRLLLFDEATSALDAHAEAVVSANFARLAPDMTKIVIAHRLSTVRNADKIIVLDHGRIIEEGSHFELAAARGHYFDLVRNQLELGQ